MDGVNFGIYKLRADFSKLTIFPQMPFGLNSGTVQNMRSYKSY